MNLYIQEIYILVICFNETKKLGKADTYIARFEKKS